MKKNNELKPFVKWAGGKSQLVSQISDYFPKKFTKYAEPFVGGGAILWHVLQNYDLEKVYISDINMELINTYKVIRDDVEKLIEFLKYLEDSYLKLDTESRKEYFYNRRKEYNDMDTCLETIQKAALFIFLNKTCFNGLYRVNKKGEFNVPIGSYKQPLICDSQNLLSISKALENVIIVHGDYKQSSEFIDEDTLVYFDPPYRPLSTTASFTSYSKQSFDDDDQKELARFIDEMNVKGATFILSNSDPKNTSEEDNFFDDLYDNYKILRVEASRMINSKATSRGKISELLIMN